MPAWLTALMRGHRTATRRQTPQRQPSAADSGPESPGSVVTPTNPLPATPFNRRVRLLIEVVDQPDEVDLAARLLADRGWAVRPVTEADNATVGDRRVGLIVEVRLRGSRKGARNAAAGQVERLADQAKVGLWVRDSVQLELTKERRTTYFAHNLPAEGGRFTRWAAELWAAIGGADIERALSLPGPADEAAATAELQRRTLGGKQFDPAMHTVRVPVGPRSPVPDDAGRRGPGSGGGPGREDTRWLLRHPGQPDVFDAAG
jgi:hypothetical protein